MPPMPSSWKWERRAKLQQVDCGGSSRVVLEFNIKDYKTVEMNCTYYLDDIKKLKVVIYS